MPQHLVHCQYCEEDFPVSCDNTYQGDVSCTHCHASFPFQTSELTVTCPHCNVALSVPANTLASGSITCPACGRDFAYTGMTPLSQIKVKEPESAQTRPANGKQILANGTVIENYRIDRLIGAGGMAEVYLAHHIVLERECALKIMKPSAFADDEIQSKRFIREAQLALKLNHPNIVQVFDAGCDKNSGLLFIAMEYVKGRNLADFSQGNKVPESMLLHICEEITKALIAMHEKGIVHRDIKPSNIIMCKDGAIKLMDLGIAKADLSSDDNSKEAVLTLDQTVLGTPAYASPEQCRSAHSADIRSDIYCLGASLYHIASGQPPYGGTTAMEVLLKVIETTPKPLHGLRPDLSKFTISLIEQMMEKQPEKRPQTPEELHSILLQNSLRHRIIRFMKYAVPVALILLLVFAGVKTAPTLLQRIKEIVEKATTDDEKPEVIVEVVKRKVDAESAPPEAGEESPTRKASSEKGVSDKSALYKGKDSPQGDMDAQPEADEEAIMDSPDKTAGNKKVVGFSNPAVKTLPVDDSTDAQASSPDASNQAPNAPAQVDSDANKPRGEREKSHILSDKGLFPTLFTPTQDLQERMQMFLLAQEMAFMKIDDTGMNNIHSKMKEIRINPMFTNPNVLDFIEFIYNHCIRRVDDLPAEFFNYRKQFRKKQFKTGRLTYEIEAITNTGITIKELYWKRQIIIPWQKLYTFENSYLFLEICKLLGQFHDKEKAGFSAFYPAMTGYFFAARNLQEAARENTGKIQPFTALFPNRRFHENVRKLERLQERLITDADMPKVIAAYEKLEEASKAENLVDVKTIATEILQYSPLLFPQDIQNLQTIQQIQQE